MSWASSGRRWDRPSRTAGDVGAVHAAPRPHLSLPGQREHIPTVASVLCDFVLLCIIYASPQETPTRLASGNRADAVGPAGLCGEGPLTSVADTVWVNE